MEFDNSFEVPLPPAQAWAVLMDIRRIAPCMPGAELTEIVDGKTYKGKIAVRLGPVALTFAGVVQFEELDNAHYKARVKAQGSDSKGRGGAHATAAFALEPVAGGSNVLVHTNLNLSGAVAQYGRGVGMVQATAAQIMKEFANNLKAQIAQQGAAASAATATTTVMPAASTSGASAAAASASATALPPPAAKPISGFSLMARVIWDTIVRLLKGKSKSS